MKSLEREAGDLAAFQLRKGVVVLNLQRRADEDFYRVYVTIVYCLTGLQPLIMFHECGILISRKPDCLRQDRLVAEAARRAFVASNFKGAVFLNFKRCVNNSPTFLFARKSFFLCIVIHQDGFLFLC